MTRRLLPSSKYNRSTPQRLRWPAVSNGDAAMARMTTACIAAFLAGGLAFFGTAPRTCWAQDDAPKAAASDVSSPSDQPRGATAPAADETKSAAGMSHQTMLISSLTIFVLAIFVGFEVITKVPPTLHTPLMSGSNAISGITIVGAIIVTGHAGGFIASSLGFFAVVFATINVIGGFLVTHRMLSMFKKR